MTKFLFLRKSFYDDSYLLAIFLKKQRNNNIDTIFEPSYALFVYKLHTKGDSSHRLHISVKLDFSLWDICTGSVQELCGLLSLLWTILS